MEREFSELIGCFASIVSAAFIVVFIVAGMIGLLDAANKENDK